MKRTKNHEIGDAGVAILRLLVPSSWILNEQFSDYGKDFLVEIPDNQGNATGECFFIQLKTTEKVKQTAKSIKFDLKGSHALYFRRVEDLPIFLVLIDRKKRQGWWIFTQEYLRRSSFDGNRTMRISIPRENDIADHPRFENAIRKARIWLVTRRRSLLQNVMDSLQEEIAEADPRLQVAGISVIDGQTTTLIQSDSPVNIQLKPLKKSKRVLDKFAAFERGMMVEFAEGEAQVVGSPFFEKMSNDGFAAQATVTIPAETHIKPIAEEGKTQPNLLAWPGSLSGGISELAFLSHKPGCPLSVALGPLTKSDPGTLKLNFKSDLWDNHDVACLPYFDELFEVLESLSSSSAIQATLYARGSLVSRQTAALTDASDLQGIIELFRWLQKLKKLTTHFRIPLLFSRAKSEDDSGLFVEQLHDIIFEGGWTGNAENIRMGATLTSKPSKRCLSTRNSHVLFESGYAYELFGYRFIFSQLLRELTNARVALVRAAKADAAEEDGYKIEVFGSRKTIAKYYVRAKGLPEIKVERIAG